MLSFIQWKRLITNKVDEGKDTMPPPYKTPELPSDRWKKKLEATDNNVVDWVIDKIIQTIDAEVEQGLFPDGVMIMDLTTTALRATMWKTNAVSFQAGERKPTRYLSCVCVKDEKDDFRKNFVRHLSLSKDFEQKFYKQFQKRTGLILTANSCERGLRVKKPGENFAAGLEYGTPALYVQMLFQLPTKP